VGIHAGAAKFVLAGYYTRDAALDARDRRSDAKTATLQGIMADQLNNQ
jgi:hypothetical protein